MTRRRGATYRSAEWRRRVGEGVRRAAQARARRARQELRELAVLARSGTTPGGVAPYLEAAGREAAELLDALGGVDRVSPQRRVLIEDTARLGLVLRSLLVSFVQGGGVDGETGSRIATLANARRANLSALGLDRHVEDVPDLTSYLAKRAAEAPLAGDGEPEPGEHAVDACTAAEAAIDAAPDAEAAPDTDRGSWRDSARPVEGEGPADTGEGDTADRPAAAWPGAEEGER